MQLDLSKKAVQWFVLCGLAFVWGSSYFFIKMGLRSFAPLELALLRISIAFLVLLPVVLPQIKYLKRRNILPLIVVGLLGNGFPALLFALAQTSLSSSFAGILNSMVPVWTLLIGLIVFKVKFLKVNLIGIFIGFLGAILLVWIDSSNNVSFTYMGAIYVVLATLCYGTSVNIIKESLVELPPRAITAFAFLFMGIPTLLITILLGIPMKAFQPDVIKDFGYIILLSVFGTALAVLYFNKLIKYTSAIFATTVTYLIPIVAVFWGVLDGEAVTGMHIVACLIILVGVYLVNLKKKV